MARSDSSSFGTFLIIGPTCFFLGILFASFPYDYYVLWSTPPLTQPPYPRPFPDISSILTPNDTLLRAPYLNLLEHHLKFLYQSPPLISRILHIAIGTGLIGLMTKLYKPTEANMLFDGASLVLYMCGITVYISNLVKGMRVVTLGSYGRAGADLAASRFGSNNEALAAEAAAAAAAGTPLPAERSDGGLTSVGREDSLRVMAASNTILALVLVGVLILQAGQWYAQKKEQAEIEEMDRVGREKRREKKEGAVGGGAANAVASGFKKEEDVSGDGGKKRR